MLRALRVGVGFEIRLLFLACRRDLRSARRLSHRHAVQPRVQPQAGLPFVGRIGPSLSFCTSFCTAVFPRYIVQPWRVSLVGSSLTDGAACGLPLFIQVFCVFRVDPSPSGLFLRLRCILL